jgi:ferredoxin
MQEQMATIDAVGLKTFAAEDGRRLVLAIEDAGIDILHRCGGKARCTTCRIELLAGDAGEMNSREQARLAREDDLPSNVRLSCQILVEHDLTVRVINRLRETTYSDAGPRPTEELPPIEDGH